MTVVKLFYWNMSACRLAILLRVTRCIDQPKIRAYHSGAYLAGNWTWYDLHIVTMVTMIRYPVVVVT